MNSTLHSVFSLLAITIGLLHADAPKWGFLGDDESLTTTFDEAAQVVFVCVVGTELRDVKVPFAEVVHHATVIESHKGELEVGEKIQISFMTDSLPHNDEERREFVEKANKKIMGTLKFAFLRGGEDGSYHCEFMDVPNYSKEMQHFLRKLQSRPAKPQPKLDDRAKAEVGLSRSCCVLGTRL